MTKELLLQQIEFCEDIVAEFEKDQAGLGGCFASGYKTLWLANECALDHPNMLIQVHEICEDVHRTVTLRAKDYVKHFSGAKNVSYKKVTILTPKEVAAIAPWGYEEGGGYCGAGELLALGPKGLYQSPGKEAFVKFCINYGTTGQHLYNIMDASSRFELGVLKSFSMTVYSGVDQRGVSRPKYSAVYLNKGYQVVDFLKELAYLLAVVVQPA